MELCAFLRWKSFYGTEHLAEDELAGLLARNEVPYSCLRTTQAFGPDDDLVAPERCDSDRACYERSPRLVPLRRA